MNEPEKILKVSPKRETAKVYVAPMRRSAGEKAMQNLSIRSAPPNCCEETDEEDGPQDVKKNFQPALETASQRKKTPSLAEVLGNDKNGTNRQRTERIPVNDRTIPGNNTNHLNLWRNREPEPTSSELSGDLAKFHANEVPYIDSHCHTDYIYTYATQKSSPTDGVNEWVDRHKEAFPKSFAGFIANFIDPRLFVWTNETASSTFDLSWVAKEVSSSEYYLGTTWGCHPHNAQKWCKSTAFWEAMENILSDSETFKVRAVGECGIDLHRCASDLEVQKEVFERHVELAFKHQLPLVIHCRNGAKGQSEDVCLEILERVMQKNHPFLRIHRHCYTEDWPTAVKWLKMCPDVHFGFTGGIFSFKPSQLEAVRRIPLDRILLETDAPYFKPRSFEKVGPSRCALPGMAIAVAFKIAELKGLPVEEVLRATYNNTRRVYRLDVY